MSELLCVGMECLRVCVCVFMFVCWCVIVCIFVCMCMFVCMRLCVCAFIYNYVCMYMYVCTHRRKLSLSKSIPPMKKYLQKITEVQKTLG